MSSNQNYARSCAFDVDAGRSAEAGLRDLIARFEAIRQRCSVRRHARGDRIIVEGDGAGDIVLLSSGWALKQKVTIDGVRRIVDFATPGDLLGPVMAPQAAFTVEMLSDGVVTILPRSVLDADDAAGAALARHLCRLVEAAELRAQDRLTLLACRSAYLRICRFLVDLVRRQAGELAAAGPVEFPLPVRQQHLADALSLRVETVCRVLVQLRRSGLATVGRGRLAVADLSRLVAASEAADEESGATDEPKGGGVESPGVAHAVPA